MSLSFADSESDSVGQDSSPDSSPAAGVHVGLAELVEKLEAGVDARRRTGVLPHRVRRDVVAGLPGPHLSVQPIDPRLF